GSAPRCKRAARPAPDSGWRCERCRYRSRSACRRDRRPRRRCAPARRRSSRRGAGPGTVADEEWPHLHDVLRRLTRAPHRLHHVRERMQLFTTQAYHEFIVILIQTMTGEAHVVGQVLGSVSLADLGVLAQDAALFLVLEQLEGTRAP